MTLERHLRRAMENREFELHYQAKMTIGTGKIAGVEALLRWNSPVLGPVSPARFIPVAEEMGLIIPLGKWVIQTACEQSIAWQKQGLAPLCVSVNISQRQFSDPDLGGHIRHVLKDSGLEPALLELEMTESMIMHNIDAAIEKLTELKSLGLRISIDDFGTGYSSLSQLKQFPVDTLKVDRSFIRELPEDQEDVAITAAIINMGKTLGLTVIAEGVETEAQQTFLKNHACDQIQGFYFSKAIAAGEIPQLFEKQSVPPGRVK
jgi:EAL domain-containing protein (putative c-di-GMP-specific phosphodiesterase class I)